MPGTSGRDLDAVVVAATWSAERVADAAELAAWLDATLVVMCSRSVSATEIADVVSRSPELRWLAIDLPAGYQHHLLDAATSRATEVKVDRLGDLSLKRNLGLLLAKLLGWHSVLFLDEDITGLDVDEVWHAAAGLGDLDVVGLEVADFPDNSVVCHAHRLSGGHQETFVSGSALLVAADRVESFFPEIYNEDWLFFFDAVLRRSVGRSGTATQFAYEPFRNPGRAAGEEFGDVFAEGLMELAHRRLPATAADDVDYWRRYLARRAEFIRQICDRVANLQSSPLRPQAMGALEAAEQRRAMITPQICAAYLRTWRRDLTEWAARLHDLPKAVSFSSALRLLGLAGQAISPALEKPVQKGTVMSLQSAEIATLSRVAPTAQIGAPYRMLQEGTWQRLGRPTEIGAGCDIGHFCVIGEEARLGDGTIVDTYCLVEGGATIGERVVITHRASVGARAVVGDDSVIGCSLICERSQVGKNCRVFGDLVHRQLDPTKPWDAPEAEEAAPILEDNVFVGWGATVVGGITIGRGSYVCAGATVTKDISPGQIVTGVNEVHNPTEWQGALAKSDFFPVQSPEFPAVAS
ncbi:hypothetical protein MOQ72_08295 [Saccharopolyspora sp. K220]|uniref:DapH/DapD/GlmU-related protein n=1 Tax=Saccharopolyspora soli TaxID=2926618 RepID=UPI001F5603A0|nr:DapH/DapD/GlmU-related protein [Saccharopolyspora soli]MCI2417422.1 hypothetical protein [Saccharopolyspora soli]